MRVFQSIEGYQNCLFLAFLMFDLRVMQIPFSLRVIPLLSQIPQVPLMRLYRLTVDGQTYCR